VITDRLTARVLGLLLFVLPLIIAVSYFVLSRPEIRAQPRFIVIVLVPCLPLFAIGTWLLRKAERMKEDEE
jgi:O-antigen/teichoic acid export membrane protein